LKKKHLTFSCLEHIQTDTDMSFAKPVLVESGFPCGLNPYKDNCCHYYQIEGFASAILARRTFMRCCKPSQTTNSSPEALLDLA